MPNPQTASVKFKGRMLIFTILEIQSSSLVEIEAGIGQQTQQNPGLFYDMPVLLSLQDASIDLAQVKQMLVSAGLVPVGVLDADEAVRLAARRVGLGAVTSPGGAGRASDRELEPKEQIAPAAEQNKHSEKKTRLITRPVRSGQQIYARGSDLIITSSVSGGAEIIADGHIHVYGALRGRALAGAMGDTQARIFCRKFNPDLVAVAGCYKVAESIDRAVLDGPVQVRLKNEHLLIESQE